MPCQEHLIAVRDRLDDLAGTTVAAVTFAGVDRLAAHRAHLDLPFPLLADPERAVYRRFGLERAPLRRIYNPGTLKLYGQLLRRGRRLRRPVDDTRQLGGDFVIDSTGRLAAAFRPRSPDDRPDIDELVAVTRRAQAG
ncbi:MAG: AhpC/TSA family protein [Thermoanaerobaculia bacterium]